MMKRLGTFHLGAFCLVTFAILLVDKPKLASCGSIFFFMPFVSKSIKITFMPLAEEMAARGHEVVVLMPHPTKKPNPNLKEIIIDGREFIEMTDKVSEQQLKTGADGIPPVFEIFNAGLLVSI